MGENTTPLTLGEQRVRAAFNPSNNSTVDQIKQKTAELINLTETLKNRDGRLASLAQTAYEEAAMWAVKAATAEENTARTADGPGPRPGDKNKT